MIMEKFIVNGGKPLKGAIDAGGAKNIALKAIVAACLTEEEVIIHNVPRISDFFVMVDIIHELGGQISFEGHTIKLQMKDFASHQIALDAAAEIRTSFLFIAPLLARLKKAVIPNPGGCRIGARPIDRVIDGLKSLGVSITYNSEDGNFYAETKGLLGATYTFEKKSHTGTETMIIASVLAKGTTVIKNAALEPEVDELIDFVNGMGAKVRRDADSNQIIIEGVATLHGTTHTIGADRNEVVTFAIAAVMTQGDIFVRGAKKADLTAFLEKYTQAGGGYEEKEDGLRFFPTEELRAVDIETAPHPGFMTDWQGPWAVLMTKATGTAIIHERVYENRFGYVSELKKMGAHIKLFNPEVTEPNTVYHFNITDETKQFLHAAKITGPVTLHNAVVDISDLRAGATLVLAALAAKGKSVIFGIEHLDRGYEQLEKRLEAIGADIVREKI